MTNGRTPTELTERADAAAADAQAAIDNDEEPTADYTVAVSPRQLAGGFAIIAALLVIAWRRSRKKG